ncbi:MAG: hypothetical protein AB7K71_27095, partial [Polyangiaceae bacterium]
RAYKADTQGSRGGLLGDVRITKAHRLRWGNALMDPNQPYSPPATQDEMQWQQPVGQKQGSLPLGLVLGFFLGCFGLIGVLLIAKGPETKRGAWIGFGVQMVLGIIRVILMNM